MNNTETFQPVTTSEGRRILVKRPVSQFATLSAYRRLFEEEARAGLTWNHPYILKYLRYSEDTEGPFIAFESLPMITLHRALLEEPLGINTAAESRQIMNQLFEAVAYLHAQNVLHLDLRPENIFITRSAHDVKLVNPASFYVGHYPSFFIYKERYSAPELFEEGTQPSATADVYSLGRIMEYLYAYSNLSWGLKKVIARATDSNPLKRYQSVSEMQKAFQESHKFDRLTWIFRIAAVLMVVLGIQQLMKDDRVAVDVAVDQIDSLQRARRALPPSNQASDESSYSISTVHDALAAHDGLSDSMTSVRLSDDADENAALQDRAERLFKKEFRRRAEEVIAKIYTPGMLNGSEKNFMDATTTGFTELDRVQREMAQQYGLDEALTTRLSSEVITELTAEYMGRIK
jgi:serine/threonine protein kinase